MVAKVAVGEAERRPLPISKVINPVSRVRLRNTVATATTKSEDRVERGCRDRVRQSERGIRGIAKIGMEFPQSKRVLWRSTTCVGVLRSDIIIRTARRWLGHAIEIAWQQSITNNVGGVRWREK